MTCAMNYCSTVGMGGYDFAYSDSQNKAPMMPGTSMATLASDGSLCISGTVGQIGMVGGMPDYTDDWGCGIGVNLSQTMGMNTPTMAYQLSGTGVTVSTSEVPSCTTARVEIDDNGTAYCAALTSGVEIPWSAFNTECWMPASGQALSAAPASIALKVQFVASASQACPFTDFCIDSISL